MDSLSGDQKGSAASSVPGKDRESRDPSERIQSVMTPFSALAVYASMRPSGEMLPPTGAPEPAMSDVAKCASVRRGSTL